MAALQEGKGQESYDLFRSVYYYKDSLEHLNRFKRMLLSSKTKSNAGEYHWDYTYTLREDNTFEMITAILNEDTKLTYYLDESEQLTHCRVEYLTHNKGYDIAYTYGEDEIISTADILFGYTDGRWETIPYTYHYKLKKGLVCSVQQEGQAAIEYTYTYNLNIPEEIISVKGALKYEYTYEMVYDGQDVPVHRLGCFPVIFAQ